MREEDQINGGGGGGGGGGFFSLACENLGECSTIHSRLAIFIKMEISSRTLISL